MPLQATSGAASYDAFGGGVPFEPTYIEQIFSTWLYTGNGSTQTITNGIDLAGKGGLVWTKARTQPFALNNSLIDTVRGNRFQLYSDLTNAQADLGATVTNQAISSFNSNGFTLGGDQSSGCANYSSSTTYASWTFRKQPKFFDVVTYTGNGTAGRTISHSLGSVPGCIIVKKTSSADAWAVYHRGVNSNTGNGLLVLNTTAAQNVNGKFWWGDNTNFVAPTSTVFTVSNDGQVNASGETYVAYLFAHDAGGFGLTGTDNVISCGSYTGNGSATGPVVTLGYEPQWVMVKRTDSTSNWTMFDTMRGMSQTSANLLYANLSDDEGIGTQGWVVPNATGFQLAISQSSVNASGGTYIYIAIRRGPMAVPTTGTSVFAPVVYAGNGTTQNITSGFANDMQIIRRRASAENNVIEDKLRGSRVMFTNTTDSELTSTGDVTGYLNTGFTLGASNQGSTNDGGSPSYISWNFRRAPGFFDEVCYTGTGSARTVAHNLTVAPELVIVKLRSGSITGRWAVSSAYAGYMFLELTASADGAPWNFFNTAAPTSTQLNLSSTDFVNNAGGTYVAYLFASCPGVSKVGSYTGNGSSQTLNMGFTGGARFFLVKRTDSTGDWWVYDSARGIVSAADPALRLNSTAAEVTSADAVDTNSTGLIVNQESTCNINVNGATYIYLGIA